MPYLKITTEERLYLKKAKSNSENRQKNLERFWRSRVAKKDPIARIGYPLWCDNPHKIRSVIAYGDRKYWNHRDYRYWRLMADSTIVNLRLGLMEAGFEGNEVKKIEEIGVKIATQHSRRVNIDYLFNIGNSPGRLSLEQLARYHHAVFEDEGIPSHYYGGTWLRLIPDEWEFKLYGWMYCHDCDPQP